MCYLVNRDAELSLSAQTGDLENDGGVQNGAPFRSQLHRVDVQ